MEIFSFLVEGFQRLPTTVVVTSLIFLVSLLSAINSSRALRLAKKTEQRMIKRGEEERELKRSEKKSKIIDMINDGLIDVTHTKTALRVSKQNLFTLKEVFSAKESINDEQLRGRKERGQT